MNGEGAMRKTCRRKGGDDELPQRVARRVGGGWRRLGGDQAAEVAGWWIGFLERQKARLAHYTRLRVCVERGHGELLLQMLLKSRRPRLQSQPKLG